MGVMLCLRHASVTAILIASTALLAGCTGQAEGFSDLEGERTAADELPALADGAYEQVDAATSHYVGEHEGTSLWLARGLENSPVCIVAYAEEEAWQIGCGGAPATISGVTGTYEIVMDGAAAPAGAVKVSENVYAW